MEKANMATIRLSYTNIISFFKCTSNLLANIRTNNLHTCYFEDYIIYIYIKRQVCNRVIAKESKEIN